jgi:tRNA modification GTPase
MPIDDKTTLILETPAGQGGLALLVLEGPEAQSLLQRCSRRNRRSIPGREGGVRLMTLGFEEEVLDEVLIALVSRSELCQRYEIGLHGGPAVVEEVLSLFGKLGATIQRGGTTASLSEHHGLLEQEALEWLARASTALASRVLLMTLNGELRRLLRSIQRSFLQGAGEARRLEALRDTYDWAKLLFDPPKVVLIGAPNVGKSTLFNALLGEDRAITSEIPGTTRDYIEEIALVGGYPIILIDTAGLRETADMIEGRGIDLGMESAAAADLRIYLEDEPWPLPEATLFIEPCARVINKIDQLSQSQLAMKNSKAFFISAKTGLGIDQVQHWIRHQLFPGSPDVPLCPALFTERQRALVNEALNELLKKRTESAAKLLSQLL